MVMSFIVLSFTWSCASAVLDIYVPELDPVNA